MAQINIKNIKKIEKNRNTIHDKVYTTYTVFNADCERYVQIDTYGKIDHENSEKIGQSIQLDKQIAEFIIELLKKEFDIKQSFEITQGMGGSPIIQKMSRSAFKGNNERLLISQL